MGQTHLHPCIHFFYHKTSLTSYLGFIFCRFRYGKYLSSTWCCSNLYWYVVSLFDYGSFDRFQSLRSRLLFLVLVRKGFPLRILRKTIFFSKEFQITQIKHTIEHPDEIDARAATREGNLLLEALCFVLKKCGWKWLGENSVASMVGLFTIPIKVLWPRWRRLRAIRKRN